MGAIHVIVIVFALFALSRAYLRFRDNRLSIGEFVFWALLWIGGIIISFNPWISSYVSSFFGIKRGVDLIVYVSIVLIFYLIFRIYVKVENQQKEITTLVRKFSIDNNGKGKKSK
ncbi:MAG: DUF2304 family protein [archaeon]